MSNESAPTKQRRFGKFVRAASLVTAGAVTGGGVGATVEAATHHAPAVVRQTETAVPTMDSIAADLSKQVAGANKSNMSESTTPPSQFGNTGVDVKTDVYTYKDPHGNEAVFTVGETNQGPTQVSYEQFQDGYSVNESLGRGFTGNKIDAGWNATEGVGLSDGTTIDVGPADANRSQNTERITEAGAPTAFVQTEGTQAGLAEGMQTDMSNALQAAEQGAPLPDIAVPVDQGK